MHCAVQIKQGFVSFMDVVPALGARVHLILEPKSNVLHSVDFLDFGHQRKDLLISLLVRGHFETVEQELWPQS